MTTEPPLLQRFLHFAALSPADEARVRVLGSDCQHMRSARRDLIREGEPPRAVFLILSGWACRYKVLEDGRRQLLQFLLPGDLCDVQNVILNSMDHSIGAMTDVRYAEISHDRIEEIMHDHATLRHAFWWDTMTGMAIQREWTVNIGQRSAFERLGHLFCELFLRLQIVGLTDGDSCDMPATQTDLGDATGLTSVHVNRTIQELRGRGLIALKNRMLTIPDFEALQEAACFSRSYLHLKKPGAKPVAVGSYGPWAN